MRGLTSRSRSLLALTALAVPAVVLGAASPAHAVGGASTTNEIAYTSADTDGGLSVDLASLPNGTPKVLMPTTDSVDYDSPSLSPTGDRVVATYSEFSDTSETDGLAIVSRNGGTITRLTTNPQTDTTTFFDIEPTISPDGQTVLFTRISGDFSDQSASNFTYALMTVPAAGGSVTAVPGGAGGVTGKYDPSDPSGGTIVYDTPPADASTEEGPIYSLTGGTSTSLGVNGGLPVWSPDGTTLAYEYQTAGASTPDDTSDDVIALRTLARGSSTPTTLQDTVHPADSAATYPSWLPDSQSLVFTLFTGDSAAVYSTDVAGTKAAQVFTPPGMAEASHASVNGPAPATVAPSAASLFTAVSPTRLLDTRTGRRIGNYGTLGAGGTAKVQVVGATVGDTTIPSDATAVVMNVTAVNGSTATVVRAYPTGGAGAASSLLNTTKKGQTTPNEATVKIGSDGTVTLSNGAGTIDLIADVLGYYSPNGTAYHPLTPTRLLDSRNGTGTTRSRYTTSARDLQITGRTANGVTIPSDATAVVLNVTAVNPSTTTFIRVYPTPVSGQALPNVSSLDLVKGQTVPNLVTVAIGDLGRVRLQNAAGTIDLVADVAGYYGPTQAAGTTSAEFVPVDPTRFLDTRNGTGAPVGAVGANRTVDLAIAGQHGVPSNAVAVALNLTGTANSTATILRAYPSTASSIPAVSNSNLVKNDSRANAVLVTLGSTGAVRILNGAGTIQVVADVAGYFVPVAS